MIKTGCTPQRALIWLVILAAFLPACTQANSPFGLSFRLAPTATPTPLPIKPELPSTNPLGWPIWGWSGGVPALKIESTPQFVPFPTPRPPDDSLKLLQEAGCQIMKSRAPQVDCDESSPLRRFGCYYLAAPEYAATGLDANTALVAGCYFFPENAADIPEDMLFRVGCRAVMDVGYIFQTRGEYVLVRTKTALREVFAPIQSAPEALVYAQMATGLTAQYDFSEKHERHDAIVYFQKVIEASHAEKAGKAFRVNLYHHQYCGCTSFTISRADLLVDASGGFTWERVYPIYTLTGVGCAD